MKTLNQQAKTAGIIYLLIVLLAPFVMLYIPSQIIVQGNEYETVKNLLDNELLFRIGIIGEAIIVMIEVMIEIMIVALLYAIFKRVDKTLSVAVALSRFGMVVIMGVNVLVSAAVLPLITKPDLFVSFTNGQLNSLIYLLFNIHEYGVYVWGIFNVVHIALLGYLVVKSKFIPSLFGKALMIGSIGYLFESMKAFLNIDSLVFGGIVNILLVFSMLGEISLFIWFIFNKKLNRIE